LQPLGGGNSLQHSSFGDLLISFLGLPILGFGSETDISITPTFRGGHETFILLFGKVPNYDIQIGVRHGSFPQVPIETFPYDQVCNCGGTLQLCGCECAICSTANFLGRPGQPQTQGSVLIVLSGSGFDRHHDRQPPVGSGVENVEFPLLRRQLSVISNLAF
jgi:hypothetical protein